MCFRPADVNAGAAECPNCGKKLQAMGGVPLKKCPFCGTALDADEPAAPSKPPVSVPGTPQAPTTPLPPSAPGTAR